MCFVPFGCIRDRLVALRNSVQNRPNKCKISCHEVTSEFLATNAPNPTHWTLNWWFGAFCTILVDSEPFGCLTKLGAKRAELMQMFEPRSCVRIFRNERTRSTPLDSKLMLLCVSLYLDVFGTVWLPTKLGAKRVELVQLIQKFVLWSRIRIFRNERTQSTPLAPKLMFRCVS